MTPRLRDTEIKIIRGYSDTGIKEHNDTGIREYSKDPGLQENNDT